MNLETVATWPLSTSEPPRCAELAPNGAWLAVTEGNEIVLKQTVTGLPLQRLEAGRARILCLAIAPDSSWLVAGSDAADEWFTLRLYQAGAEKWTLASEFEAHGRTTAVAIADGAGFASGGDGVLTVWSVEGGDLWSSEPAGEIAALAFSPDGSRLAVARPGEVEVWGRDGSPLWKAPAPGCTALVFVDEHLLASGPGGLFRLREGRVEEHDARSYLADEPRERFGPGVWFGPCVSCAGALRLSWRAGLELWRDGARLWRDASVEELLVAPERLLVAGGRRLAVLERDGSRLATHETSGSLGKLGLSVNGRLAGWATGAELIVLELSSGQELGRAPRQNMAAVVGDRLVFGRLLVHPTWSLEGSLEGRSDLVAPKLVLTPDGRSACLAVPEGGLRRARLADGVTEQTYFWTSMPERQAVRGSLLLGWTAEALARWDLAGGALLDVTPCPNRSLAVSPTGARCLALGEGQAVVYDLATQTALARLALEDAGVAAALDEDTWLVAMASGELLTVRLCDQGR